MQDYAKLYRRESRKISAKDKLRRIRRVCRLDVSPDTMLVLILAIVFPAQVLSMLRR